MSHLFSQVLENLGLRGVRWLLRQLTSTPTSATTSANTSAPALPAPRPTPQLPDLPIQMICRHLNYNDMFQCQLVSRAWNRAGRAACRQRTTITIVVGLQSRRLFAAFRAGNLVVQAAPARPARGTPFGPIFGPPSTCLFLRHVPTSEVLIHLRTLFRNQPQVDIVIEAGPQRMAAELAVLINVNTAYHRRHPGMVVSLWTYVRIRQANYQATILEQDVLHPQDF